MNANENPIGTPENPFAITPADFGVGLQEVVLVHRYGGEPENADMPDNARRDLYRIAQETLADRELSFSLDIGVGDFTARLTCKRLYNAEDKIIRLVYLSKDVPSPEKIGPKPQDETAVLVALWAAQRAFKNPPKGGSILHYTFDPLKKNPIIGTYCYPVMYDDDRASEMIESRIVAIRDAFRLDDINLPQCSDVERHAQKNDPFHKCKFYCRARTYCPQARKIVKPEGAGAKMSGILLDDDGL